MLTVRLTAAALLMLTSGSQPLSVPLGLDAYLPIPEDNPLTPGKAALGRRLFFDRGLSRDRSISCASCHDPKRAFTDGRVVAVGVLGRKGHRNVPTLVNRGYGLRQFWDGRALSLEEQVLQPIVQPSELGMTLADALARLRNEPSYREQFRAAFGEEPGGSNLARALATYVRTILSGNSPVDRYMNGDRKALSAEAREGLRVFREKGHCTACHIGPNFTDERFHNSGVAWRDGRWHDSGRFAVTGRDADRGAFKTPTLREVAGTAPYMHDGSLRSLEQVIEFYDRGGNPNPYRDAELRPLGLTPHEKKGLLTFLRALSGKLSEGLK